MSNCQPTWYGYRHFEAGLHVMVFEQGVVFVDKLQPRHRAHATNHEGETPGFGKLSMDGGPKLLLLSGVGGSHDEIV